MKKILLTLSIFISSFLWISCNSDEKKDEIKKDDKVNTADVPAVVQSAFTAKYPAAKDIQWEKAKEDDKPTFKAKFKDGEKEMKAEFGEDGHFIKEKTD